MKPRHWNSLIASIRFGQTVLVVGPEIPVTAGEKHDGLTSDQAGSLVGFLKLELERELKEDGHLVNGKHLAAVAQQYEDSEGFGAAALRAAAERFYNSNTSQVSEVHRAIAELPFSLILSIGHDALLARALEEAGKMPVVHRYHMRGDRRDNPEILTISSPAQPTLYHLFGDAREPASLVLSENDLIDFLIAIASERPPLPNSLLRALRRPGQCFLFVGFGIRRWDLRVVLKVLIRALELNRGGSSFAAEPLRMLLPEDLDDTVLFYQRGTRVELENADLPAFLGEIKTRLEAAGGFVGQQVASGSAPRVFISYAREDGALALRVFDALRRAQLEPWLDRDALEGGDLWNQRIKDAIDGADFVIILYTPILSRKTDSYVNKELALARERAMSVRGRFLLPLRSSELEASMRIAELDPYNDVELRLDRIDEDLAKLTSIIKREYQLRQR